MKMRIMIGLGVAAVLVSLVIISCMYFEPERILDIKDGGGMVNTNVIDLSTGHPYVTEVSYSCQSTEKTGGFQFHIWKENETVMFSCDYYLNDDKRIEIKSQEVSDEKLSKLAKLVGVIYFDDENKAEKDHDVNMDETTYHLSVHYITGETNQTQQKHDEIEDFFREIITENK